MSSLTEQQKGVAARVVSGKEVVASCAARVYKASGRTWRQEGSAGALVLARSADGSYTFNLVNLSSTLSTWSTTLRPDLAYNKDLPYFHSFFAKDCTTGFSFANENESSTFYDAVVRRDTAPRVSTSASSVGTPNRTSYNGSTAEPYRQSSTYSTASSTSTTTTTTAGTATGGKKARKTKIDKSLIGKPQNFEHVSHVGFDSKSGFSVQNIPEDWKAVFQKAGLTDEDMKDRKTVAHTMKFMKRHAPPPGRPAPPAPPSSSAGGPRSQPPVAAQRTAPPPVAAQRPAVHTPARHSPLPTAPATPSRGPSTPSTGAKPGMRPTPPAPPRGAPPAPPPAAASQSQSHSGGPPPPPPPPPSVTIPQAVFPVPGSSSSAGQPPAGGADNRGDLLSSIRASGGLGGLKPVSQRESTTNTDDGIIENENDLAAALRESLLARKNAVGASDSEDSEDSDDDDGEWD